MRSIKSHFSNNIELYLVLLSVTAALALPLAIEVGTNTQELAATALAACVIQGLVLWVLRRRYRRVRQQMIAELRAMLKDRINNHLTVVLMSMSQRRSSPASENERELLQMAIAATEAVSRVLEELSMESLGLWKAKYQVASEELEKMGASVPSDPATPSPFIRRSSPAPRDQRPMETRAEAIPRGRAAGENRTRR